MGMGNFEGEMGGPLYSIRDTAVTCEKMAEPIVMPFRLWARTGPRNRELDGVQIPMRRGNFGGKGRPLLSIWTFCRELCRNSCTNRFAIWFVPLVGRRKHKLNRICQMAAMCTVLIVFARWRQCTQRHSAMSCAKMAEPIDWFAVWVVHLGGLKEAQVQSYLPGVGNVRTWDGALVPAGKYDWIVRLRWWCWLMSNYFDHLFEYSNSVKNNWF